VSCHICLTVKFGAPQNIVILWDDDDGGKTSEKAEIIG